MKIREFTSDDYQALVDLQNAIFPDIPAVLDDYIQADKNRDPKCKQQRWVAEADGRIVGAGWYFQLPWLYHPQRFHIIVRVLPEYQNQGIGSALYDQILAGLESFNPTELRSRGREDVPQGISFAEKRGFVEFLRARNSQLDVQAFDPQPFVGLEDKLRAEGIELKSLRELETDPDRDQKLYDLDWVLIQDVPGAEDETRVDFARWKKGVLEEPNLLPDGYIVTVDGNEYVGVSAVWADRASDMLYTGLTAVKREYRRRGIATAMKVKVIKFAQANGNSVIKTDNEQNNQPMISINTRLGFVKEPDWIELKKTIDEK